MPQMGRIAMWVGVLSATLLATVPARGADDPVEPNADVALAWRLDGISSDILGPNQPDPVWRQSIALLGACGTLDPQEPRFPRLQTLAWVHLGETAAAIKSLTAYRKLRSADTRAQVQLIDLYASQLETLDARVKYLTSLIDDPKRGLSPEVQSRLAVELTEMLAQKSPELAAAMATRAVKIYPLAEAERLYYRYVGRESPNLPDRVGALLNVLKSDPNQPAYIGELAELLASNGLADQSLRWYVLAIDLINSTGARRPATYGSMVMDYASELVIAGRMALAATTAGRMLDQQPLDPDAWFLKLAVERYTSDKVFAQSLELARPAFIRRWNAVHDQILARGAATAPAQAPPPDHMDLTAPPEKVEPASAAPVLEALKEIKNPRASTEFVSVVSDNAWFELYFDNQPDAAAHWIDDLAAILPPDSLLLQRLQGWHELVAGQPAKAREILSKVADQDPLSQLGLIRADEAEHKPADKAAIQKLLNENRLGVVAAILWTAFKSDQDRPATQPAARPVVDVLNKFPDAVLAVLDPHFANRIYELRAEPLETSIPFGVPVLARVTIENDGAYDLTIGPDSLLRPDLWFDARTGGYDAQVFPGAAYDDIASQLVLRPRQAITQLVRVDEGKLRHALQASPGSSTLVECKVITNPEVVIDPATRQEVAFPGPGGTVANFYRTFTYAGIPLASERGKKDLQDELASRSPVERIHAVDLIAAYIRVAQRQGADEDVRKAAANLPAMLEKLQHDPAPQVAGWAGFVAAHLPGAAQPQKIVDEMAASPQWTTRLLAIFAAKSLPPDAGREVASRLANDPDPLVKQAASAALEFTALAPPTTQPATNPHPEQ